MNGGETSMRNVQIWSRPGRWRAGRRRRFCVVFQSCDLRDGLGGDRTPQPDRLTEADNHIRNRIQVKARQLSARLNVAGNRQIFTRARFLKSIISDQIGEQSGMLMRPEHWDQGQDRDQRVRDQDRDQKTIMRPRPKTTRPRPRPIPV